MCLGYFLCTLDTFFIYNSWFGDPHQLTKLKTWQGDHVIFCQAATSDDTSQAVEQAKVPYNAYNGSFTAQRQKFPEVERNELLYRAYNQQSAAQRLAVLSNND